MDSIEVIRYQVRRAYDWLDTIVVDVTDEVANWQPGGLANSIASTYAHTFISADEDFNQVYLGGEMVIKGEWAGRAGLSEPPPFGEWGWGEWGRRMTIDWRAFQRYAAAIRATIDGILDGMTEDDLRRDIDMTPFGIGIWKGLDLFLLHALHPYIHGGEIGCLKGMQGMEGRPGGPGRPMLAPPELTR
jgi:hypothetical protein